VRTPIARVTMMSSAKAIATALTPTDIPFPLPRDAGHPATGRPPDGPASPRAQR
jgi:hypothetical protein